MKPEVDLGCRTIDLVFCKGWLFQNRERQERNEEWGGVRREREKWKLTIREEERKTTDRLAFGWEESVGTCLACAAVSMDVQTSSWCMTRSGIAGLFGPSNPSF